jgi:hypothetical protein
MSNQYYRQGYTQAGSSQQQQQPSQNQPQQHQQQGQPHQARMTEEPMEFENSADDAEHWEHILDPLERRKMQNRIAQRRFRECRCRTHATSANPSTGAKKKEEREEARREQDNRARAGSIYQSPEPREMGDDRDLSGLPWGGFSMGHMAQSNRAKEEQARRSSQEATSYSATSGHGGSSR